MHVRAAVAAALLMFASTACSEQKTSGSAAAQSQAAPQRRAARVDGHRAMQYAREVVSFGARHSGSPGYSKLHDYLRSSLRGINLEEIAFTATTPKGKVPMRNFVAKFPGRKPGVVLIAGHYDTVRKPGFVGANDGGSSTALLIELANQLRGPEREGHTVWLVWFDGEEAVDVWSDTDSLYGSRHMAEAWTKDRTIKKIRAMLLVDMVGDAQLNIDLDLNSDQALVRTVKQAADRLGYGAHFFGREAAIGDDHIPFIQAGVPAIDLIDYNFGPNNSWWHTSEDSIDKLSSRSLEVVGSTVLETLAMLDAAEPARTAQSQQ